jgi:hypothetical protein
MYWSYNKNPAPKAAAGATKKTYGNTWWVNNGYKPCPILITVTDYPVAKPTTSTTATNTRHTHFLYTYGLVFQALHHQ